MPIARFAALLVAVLLPLRIADAGVLEFTSETGDFVGAGIQVHEVFDDGEVWADFDGDRLYFFKLASEPPWTLSMRSGNTQSLAVGCYERGQRIFSSGPSRPGFRFAYDQRDCQTIDARFRVLELETAPGTTQVTSLAVDFVQHCEFRGPALFGKLRFGSSVPLDTPELAPVVTVSGLLDIDSEQGVIQVPFDQRNFRTIKDYENAVVSWFTDFDDSMNFWSLSIAAPDDDPLTIGEYENPETYPVQSDGHPGLSYRLANPYCHGVPEESQFSVLEMEVEPIERHPRTYDVSFSGRCEGAVSSVEGRLRFTADYNNGPIVDETIYLDGLDGYTAWPLAWHCE